MSESVMPGRGTKASGGSVKPKVKHIKAKQQKKRFIRSKDPILSVFMWGIQHSINELTTGVEPSLLLPEDFKAFSKIRVENQYYNKENLPGHFKFKEYCPKVFHDLRKRCGMDDVEYMNSLITKPPLPMDNPGRSGAKFFVSYDRRLVVKSITSEEVALLHQILQPYHAHVVTSEAITLLPQYFGTYRLTVNNAETYWMVMRSVFSSSLKMHRKFDLKGSTVDRLASDKEKAKINPTLKDLDFTVSGEKITIGEDSKEVLMKALHSDVQMMQKLNLMDYSLLVGIHDCTLTSSPEELPPNEEEDPVPPSPLDPAQQPPAAAAADTSQGGGATGREIAPAQASAGPDADSAPNPAVVSGTKAVEAALLEGLFPVVDKMVDVFAVPSCPGSQPQIYYLAIIDVLTNYGARKRAAHAAKTMKHGAGAEISTVRPETYARRFLEFLSRVIV